MKSPITVKRGRMTYILYPEKVIVGIGDSQWVSYNQYDNWNRQGIAAYRNTILKSKPNEYDNPVDQMTLALQCGIRGTSTTRPKV